MRASLVVPLAMLLLVALPIRTALSADYTPTSLVATVYVDGVVGVEYRLDVNPTIARVTVSLFGSKFADLIAVNQNGLPLVTTQAGSSLTVDTLGSSNVTITYTTQELTTKAGALWTFNVSSPANVGVYLPTGATIISLSEIPLDVGTVNGAPFVTLPAGNISVSYFLSAVGTREHAQTAIQSAELTINTVKTQGISTLTADGLLAQAKTAFAAGDYLRAEQYATQAKAAALDAKPTPVADSNYTLLIAAGILVVAVAIAAVVLYVLHASRAPPPTTQPNKKSEDGPVNLDAVFAKNADLRVDDREVVRFLAERGGEAFANEIRDRFKIPRTSAWRMIRRLITLGVVEERKVGSHSLICVVKKYRRTDPKE